MVDQVFSFIYLSILISAYRWYLKGKRPLLPWRIIFVGMTIISIYVLRPMAARQSEGYQIVAKFGNFVTDAIRLPRILVGIGIFALFKRKTFHSRLIDWAAAGSFAVYLITDHEASQVALWSSPLNLGLAVLSPANFMLAMLIILGIYFACPIVDSARRALFRRFFDSKRDRLFLNLEIGASTVSANMGFSAFLDERQVRTERKS